MANKILLHNMTSKKANFERAACITVFVGLLLLMSIGFSGCKDTTISPTEPSTAEPSTAEPSTEEPTIPTPVTPEAPVTEAALLPEDESYDDYGENPDDPDLETLEVDDQSYIITMDYTGDIDWYKVQIPEETKTVSISLTDIPEESDFDIIAYDFGLTELDNGRSTQSGNASEYLLLSPVESPIYLKIYSYSGRGEATLTLTTEETRDYDETEFPQLTYEEVLSTYYSFYPRGTNSGLLEHSVETVKVEEIVCQTADSLLSGVLAIGNYAHVERELLESVDYIDGWAVVVFNGPVSVLDELTITIRVTIFAPELDLEVVVPSEMEIDGYDYLVSETGDEVYYISQSYGDFWGNSSDDIQVSSGVIGDLGDLASYDIFTQQVDVQWSLTDSNGMMTCSGRTRGKPIFDFEMAKLLFLSELLGQ